jgi:hypothetical protein
MEANGIADLALDGLDGRPGRNASGKVRNIAE